MKTRPSVSCLLPVVWLLASALGSHAQTLTVTNDLQLWLRADAGVTTNASGGVTQWEDQSGNANHATQVTNTQAPLLVNAQLNNRSVLRFDGTDDFLNVADSESLSFSGDLTTLCVIKFNDFANYNAVWGKTAGNLPAPTDLYTLPGSGFVRAYRGNGTSANLSHVDSAQPLGPATYLVLGVEVAGETLTHYLRNQPNGSGTVNTDTADANTDLTIGTRQDRFTQLKGELAELLIYSRALSPGERSDVFNYLQTKYALPLVVTHLGDSGPGSLRQAIADASSGDTITFATSGTITLTSGQLFITKDLTIVGPGPANLAVSGNNSTRVLSIGVGSAVNISGLTVRNGLFFSGGGVQNSGTLVMSNCVITANATFDGSTSGTGGNGGIGAGIYNAGALTLIACTVNNNRAGNGRNGGNGGDGVLSSPHGIPGTGGGSGGDGGGIYNVGPLSLIACTINHNAAGDGGAGGNGGNGALGLDNPPFGDGGAGGAGGEGGFGGGLYDAASASLTLSNCTLYGNSAGRGGRGGNGGSPASTFAGSGIGGRGGSGGEAGNGGGVYNADLAELELTACTLSSNTAGAGGNGGTSGPGNIQGGQGRRGGDGGGIYTLSVASTPLRNSIVASNHPGVGGQGGLTFAQVGRGADLHGTNFVSHGHNLVGNNDTYFVLLNQNSTDIVPADYYQTNPLLAALGDNGGPTLTVALLAGSPAIDAGDDTLLTNALANDQRGVPRLSGAHVDIGAFEAQVLIVLNTSDSGPGSLRDTLVYSSPSETITFAPSLSGQTIYLTSGQLTVAKSLTIDASSLAGGVIIDASGNSRVLEITAGNMVTLNSLTLMNGNSAANFGFGGGILLNSASTLTLSQATLSGNAANQGGAIYTDYYSTLILNNSTLSENSARFGGGIYNEGGHLEISNSTLSGNSATNFGGGILQMSDILLLTNTIVSGNTASSEPNIFGPFDGANNLVDVDPLLAPLGNYGGRTPTMRPRPGSPAIDAGTDSVSNFLATDQRGFPRLSGAHVDIGAVETRFLVVSNSNDSGTSSLRDGIATAPELVTFANALSGQTITLTSGQIVIASDLTIDASTLAGGISLSGNHNSRIFQVDGGANVTLDSLTLTAGTALSGGGILVNSGGALSLNHTTLSGNSAAFGGGIASYGTLTVRASTIVGNFATNNSGGLENDGGTMLIEGSIISSNSAVVGGGIANWFSGTLTVSGCTVVHNFAAYSGGGIYNNSSTLGLNNSTLFGNSAPLGGGISNEDTGAVVLNSSTISANSATSGADSGGGIRNPLGVCVLTNAIVAGNTAGNIANNISGPFSGTNSVTNGNPLLAPLGNYGGPTPTMPPLHSSPAIDAGADSVTNFLSADQRGYPRLSGACVDIGAVEAQAAPPGDPPLLMNPMIGDHGLSFDCASVPNADFSVLGSTNLTVWDVLGLAIRSSPGQYYFRDPESANFPRRFYKVTSP